MLKILITDDVAEDLGFVERVLRQCKIANPVQLLHSGQECLDHFETHPKERFLVILDMMMEPVNGLSVLRRLHAKGMGQDSIFIMLSGITDIKVINEGYKAGARTFLIKPLKTEDILELLNALKDKIAVETNDEGYTLRWSTPDVSVDESKATPSDTKMLRRGIGFSA